MSRSNLPAELIKHAATIDKFALPCVGFTLSPLKSSAHSASRLGAEADLPKGFVWPTRKNRKLDFLLQISLQDLAAFPGANSLPGAGLLSFFYDLKDQPWGYDPKDLDGFRVIYTAEGSPLERHAPPHPDEALNPCSLKFGEARSFPHYGSRDFDRLEKEARFDERESEIYMDFADENSRLSPDAPHHRLLGHSNNVQGDMQLEAQLVTNGLYCGDGTGYNDARAGGLELGAEEWCLLLQLDSDDEAGFMWGDCGMLYYWIRRQDLLARRFDRVWMSLQCS